MFKPATPGFLTTLAATVLLVVVSFSVPWFKTIYFLKASLTTNGQSGFITFGTLGYCLTLNGQQTCTKATIGYNFDLNALVGNGTQIQIPEVFSKWLTYVLFLHVVALILAAISSLFGLLAHVREMSMSWFSTCISGGAAFVTLIAFIFDLAIFFLARTRVRAIEGGSAEIGQAIWLTLAAWLLLFFAGWMYGIGRCCIAKRPSGMSSRRKPAKEDPEISNSTTNLVGGGGSLSHAEQMRMDAVKAENDRKARQAAAASRKTREEKGLPAFEEFEYETRPLTEDDEGPPFRDTTSPPRPGYVPYNTPGVGTGAPQPRRQPSAGSVLSDGGRQPSNYAAGPSRNAYPPNNPRQTLHSRRDLAESDMYGQIPPSNNNNYLRPNAGPNTREASHHTQASSYHSATSQQPDYPTTYHTTPGVDYNSSRGEYDTYARPVPAPTPQPPRPQPTPQPRPVETYQSYYPSQESYSQYPPQQQQQQPYPPYGGQAQYGASGAAISRPHSTATDMSRHPQRQLSSHSSHANYRPNDFSDAPPLPTPNFYAQPLATNEHACGGYTSSPSPNLPPLPPLPASLTPGLGAAQHQQQTASQLRSATLSPGGGTRLDPWREVSETSQQMQQPQREPSLPPLPTGPPPQYDDGIGPSFATGSSAPTYATTPGAWPTEKR